MKRSLLIFFLLLCVLRGQSQVEMAAKLNAFYACVGLVNPSVEFALSPKSTLQTEVVYSPWRSVNGHKMNFGILMTEYRWHLKGHFNGVYFGANAGMQMFKISKPYIEHGKLRFNTGYAKGAGAMLGLSVGYEKIFAERWIFDAFLSWSRMWSYYNGYDTNNEIMMYPEGHENDNPPDPWNGSAEWYPNKVGISLGYIFNKK